MNYTHRFLVFCLVVVISSAHYGDVIMDTMASQITSHTIVYPTVYSDTDQRKHQSSAPLAFVWGIHRWPVNSPHKRPVMRKVFPFDNVIMYLLIHITHFICGTSFFIVSIVPNQGGGTITTETVLTRTGSRNGYTTQTIQVGTHSKIAQIIH